MAEERNSEVNRSGAPYYEICYGCEKGTPDDDLDMIVIEGNPGALPFYFHPECRKKAIKKIKENINLEVFEEYKN